MNAPAEGMHGTGIPLAEYLAWPYPSKGWLPEAARSLLHLQQWLLEKEDPNFATDSMETGSLFHTAILEPDEIAKRYALEPSFGTKKETGTTIAEQRAAWEDAMRSAGKTPASSQALSNARNAAREVRKNPILLALLDGAEIEGSFVWHEPFSDSLVKGRTDAWCPAHNVILEVKTTRSAEAFAFTRTVETFKYYCGAALYRDAVGALLGRGELPTVLFLAVEQAPPFASALYELEPAWIDAGRDEYQKLLKGIKEAQETNVWPPPSPKIQLLERPMWAKRLPLPGYLEPMPF